MRLSSISLSLLFCSLLSAAPADLIVSAGRVVTMDAQRHVIVNGAVAIAKGRILAVGPKAEIDKQYRSAKRIDRPDAILTPGLINTHTHAAMSLLRGIADDMALQKWLEKFIFPAEGKNVNEQFVRAGTRLAVLEMMLGGTTTYVDMYYFEDAVAEETKKAGMRGVLGQTIIGFPAPDYKTPELALAGTEKFLERFKNDPLIVPAVAPHAIYTNSAQTLKAARALANKYQTLFITHVSETQKENIDSGGANHNMTPTAYLESLGAMDGRTLFAHEVWTRANDILALKRHSVGIAHCPSSNMKLGSGTANIMGMLRTSIPVGLGTDGPAGSNNDFDMFEEMDLASKLAKVSSQDPTVLPATQAFAMATIAGAQALGMDKEIGSLEPGKRADLITVSTDAPNGWPMHDVYSMLVYSLKASDVQDVVIEGKATVENRKPLTLNPLAIRREAKMLRDKVDASLK
ncbi:amidohydrolase family protein [uncultured Paludibaculum sp.]|uniref:amidohydrolase family protein n=1 Tax=uncultured Paludibaculum sp. TaxID=1765020 RepID=UPI002AAAA371|nr:amidohydrolase family protein [uncultured Paludibaculum sp.]